MFDKFFYAITFLFVFFQSATVKAQSHLIPQPAFQKLEPGAFSFSSNIHLSYPSIISRSIEIFKSEMESRYGFKFDESKEKNIAHEKSIVCKLNRSEKEKPVYNLVATEKNITIQGNETGIFYGLQSLLFLLPPQKDNPWIQVQTIIDSAQFEYRGLHLDVSRHFRSPNYIKKYLDLMAMHKLNRFHWHLTDDQGWRIEIKKYPKLTETGSRRNQTLVGPYGCGIYDGTIHQGFYTQKEIKEIVSYANERKITIIPEIEMPGHSSAALNAYPFLGCTKGPYQVMETWGVSDEVICAGNDSSYRFLEDVIEEVIGLFPGKYIHIGGDECPKTRWKSCKNCQNKIKEMHLKDEHELQSYFVKSMEEFINSKKRTLIGWDEILEGGLAPNAIVMSWRGESGGIEAAKLNHEVIMTPGKPLYFDHTQSMHEDSVTQGGYNSLEMVYHYNPIPKELNKKQSKFILGAQANMWTEYMNNESKLEYMLFPRLSALSEALWTSDANKNWDVFQTKIPGLFLKFDFLHLNYSKAYYDLEPTISSEENGNLFWSLKSRFPDANIFVEYPKQKNEVLYTTPIQVNQSGNYSAFLKTKNGKSLSSPLTQDFLLHKASGRKCILSPLPDYRYPGHGPQTLVDGVINETGLSSSSRFLGYWGQDVTITLDLGKETAFERITPRFFEQPASWIYAPENVSISMGNDLSQMKKWEVNPTKSGNRHINYLFQGKFYTRFIQISVKCAGKIPPNNPGEGNLAWLFMDEVIVE
ncbi:MAG: hypothetical protein RL582_1949 [Bacteroidota bacterium]|jgi:hexosaminidase